MSLSCELARAEIGNGIAASLRAVDCVASDMTQSAFGRLFGSGGALVPALTILLTLYVAFFAVSLLTGRSRIGVSALTPRMITLGLVLTFATSWVAYQSVVWNLATGAPDQIAAILMGTSGSATQVFAEKLDIVFLAVSEAAGDTGGAEQKAGTAFSPPGLMWMGAMLLLLGTVGVLVTARIALAVLVATGPVFVVMALFPATRGVFAGWLRGVVMLGLAPLFAVLGGGIMLELAVPVIGALAPVPGEIDARAAMAFFLIGAVHVALMVLVMRTAAVMVGNWRVFGFGGQARERGDAGAAAARSIGPTPAGSAQQLAAPAPAMARRAEIAATLAPYPANDAAGPSGGALRETRITTITPTATGNAAHNGASPSRTRGIGSRYRAASPRPSENRT